LWSLHPYDQVTPALVCKKLPNFVLGHFFGMASFVEKDEALDPVCVSVFGLFAEVLYACNGTDLIE
jgi:hypothetical protein